MQLPALVKNQYKN